MTGDMSKAHIIFLNGTSSAGKGIIAAALLESLPTPYVHVGFDDFIRLTRSPAYYGEQGFQLLEENDGLGTRYTMAIGALGERFFSGMHHAVASFAAAGNNLIVDTVLWDRTWFGGVCHDPSAIRRAICGRHVPACGCGGAGMRARRPLNRPRTQPVRPRTRAWHVRFDSRYLGTGCAGVRSKNL